MGDTVFLWPADLKAGHVLAGPQRQGSYSTPHSTKADRTVKEVTTHINFQTAHRHFIVWFVTHTDLTFQIFAADVMVEVESSSLSEEDI